MLGPSRSVLPACLGEQLSSVSNIHSTCNLRTFGLRLNLGGRERVSHRLLWEVSAVVHLLPSQAHLQAPPVATAAAAVAAAAAAASVVSTTTQSLKLTYPEVLDRIKEEFQFLQNQYHR